MPPRLFIFSDPTIASYGTIGRLYHDTMAAMGVRVTHAPYPSRDPGLPRGATVLHAALGFRGAPFAGVRNIAVPFHEWDRYPVRWADRLNAFDEVWAATTYLADVLRRSGVRRPIHVLPPALDLKPPRPRTQWTGSGSFKFLFVGEPHFRKGHHLLIDGFRRLRLPPSRATLTIKTSAECGWTVTDPGVHLITERWSAHRMRQLYARHDAFVSASLAEGLGLGVAEAALARLPVAANYWSGHTAVLAPHAFVRIPHRVVPQPFCSRPDFYAPGQHCALSSPDGVAAAMDTLLTMPARDRRANGLAAAAWVREQFGLATCAPRLRAALLGAHEDVAERPASVRREPTRPQRQLREVGHRHHIR